MISALTLVVCCCWSRKSLMPGYATLSSSTPDTITTSFHFQTQPVHSLVHPLEAPLPDGHGHLTWPSVSSSCCDQRASCFHLHWIFQPAQRREEDMSSASGKGGVPASQDYTVFTHHYIQGIFIMFKTLEKEREISSLL